MSQVFRRNILGASIVTILLASAGFVGATADVGGLFDAGGDAAAGVDGDYSVDGSGAYQAAAATAGEARAKATGAYDQADAMLDNTPQFDVECPQTDLALPDPPLDAVNAVDVDQFQSVNKAANLDTGLVDADADVGAWGHVKGWFTGVADAVTGLFGAADSIEKPDACGMLDEAQSHVDLSMVADVRGQARSLAHTEIETPALDPRIDGSYQLEHAGELAGDASGSFDGIVTLP